MKSDPASAVIRIPPRERAERLSKSLGEAARRLRFSNTRTIIPDSFRTRRNARLNRLFTIGSFIGLVLAPSLTAMTYYGFIAADQYVAEARFAVRGGALAGVDAVSSLTGVPPIQIIQDTQVITNYLQSRALVEKLEESAGFKERYSSPEADILARLNLNQSIEHRVKYWVRMSAVSIEMPGGIVKLTVRAFRPDDAVVLANAAINSSEQLVNEMNLRSRNDALRSAQQEFQTAASRLAEARAALEGARNHEGVLDATSEASKTGGLITALRGEQLELHQQLDALSRSVSVDAPQMRNLQYRIEAVERQIAHLRRELTADGDMRSERALSGSLTRLTTLDLERQVAEKQYIVAASALERARLAANSKQIYLSTFVRPVAAEEGKYPRRMWNSIAALGIGLVAWGCFVGVARLARNQFA